MLRIRILIATTLVFWLLSGLCFAQEDTSDSVSEFQPESENEDAITHDTSDSVSEFQPESKGEYIISPDDVIQVTVYGEPDLSTTLKVSQEGTINYPLLGNIRASGLTMLQLEKNITELLGEDYLIMPQVNVFIAEYSKFSILGYIGKPGSYEIKERLTLTQAIAMAGGFTDQADASSVKIIRTGKNEKETIEVDVAQILEKALVDVELKPNDTIIIGTYGSVSIIGQVQKPGIYSIKKDLTAMDLISLAGGFTPLAAQNGTRVIRDKGDRKQVIPVPVTSIMRKGDASRDVVLQEGDTVVVPESFF